MSIEYSTSTSTSLSIELVKVLNIELIQDLI